MALKGSNMMKNSLIFFRGILEPSAVLMVPLMLIADLLVFGYLKDCSNPYWPEETCWNYNSYGNYK